MGWDKDDETLMEEDVICTGTNYGEDTKYSMAKKSCESISEKIEANNIQGEVMCGNPPRVTKIPSGGKKIKSKYFDIATDTDIVCDELSRLNKMPLNKNNYGYFSCVPTKKIQCDHYDNITQYSKLNKNGQHSRSDKDVEYGVLVTPYNHPKFFEGKSCNKNVNTTTQLSDLAHIYKEIQCTIPLVSEDKMSMKQCKYAAKISVYIDKNVRNLTRDHSHRVYYKIQIMLFMRKKNMIYIKKARSAVIRMHGDDISDILKPLHLDSDFTGMYDGEDVSSIDRLSDLFGNTQVYVEATKTWTSTYAFFFNVKFFDSISPLLSKILDEYDDMDIDSDDDGDDKNTLFKENKTQIIPNLNRELFSSNQFSNVPKLLNYNTNSIFSKKTMSEFDYNYYCIVPLLSFEDFEKNHCKYAIRINYNFSIYFDEENKHMKIAPRYNLRLLSVEVEHGNVSLIEVGNNFSKTIGDGVLDFFSKVPSDGSNFVCDSIDMLFEKCYTSVFYEEELKWVSVSNFFNSKKSKEWLAYIEKSIGCTFSSVKDSPLISDLDENYTTNVFHTQKYRKIDKDNKYDSIISDCNTAQKNINYDKVGVVHRPSDDTVFQVVKGSDFCKSSSVGRHPVLIRGLSSNSSTHPTIYSTFFEMPNFLSDD